MLIMVEKGITGGICHSIDMQKLITKTRNTMTKAKNHDILGYKQFVWMSQKLPLNNFEWIKDVSQFNERFMKNYTEDIDEGHFLEVDVQYLEKLHELHNDLLFLLEKMKIEKIKRLLANLHDKMNTLYAQEIYNRN